MNLCIAELDLLISWSEAVEDMEPLSPEEQQLTKKLQDEIDRLRAEREAELNKE